MKPFLYLIFSLVCSSWIIGAQSEKTVCDIGSKGVGDLAVELFTIVQKHYVDDISPEKWSEAIAAGIDGFLNALDRHSGYCDKDSLENMMKGEFGGLGAEISNADKKNEFKVIAVFPNGPSGKAGLKKGDVLLEVDDIRIKGLSLNKLIQKTRGKVGSTVKLRVKRKGAEKPVDITVVREKIIIKSVEWEIKDKTMGYIRILTFDEKTFKGVKEALGQLRNLASKKKLFLQGIVLDLRGNAGGIMDEAISIASLFIPKGDILLIKGDKIGKQHYAARTEEYMMNNKNLQVPCVVLIDGGTASAAEILAGALQEHKAAVLIGEPTFGKGSVQQIYPLGNGAIKLTISRYYTPQGKPVQSVGIFPDVEVRQVEKIIEKPKEGSSAREKDLSGVLETRDMEGNTVLSEPLTSSDTETQEEIKDYQLKQALNYAKFLFLHGRSTSSGQF